MHRRDLFDPKNVAKATGTALGAFIELNEDDPPPVEGEVPLLQLTRRAMATNFEILVPFGTPNAQDAANAAFDLIDDLETQMTIYRDTSEVSKLNQRAHSAPVRVEERLFQLFQTAVKIHRETKGAFDISAGALIKTWGFFKGPPRIPSSRERDDALSQIGMNHVHLDEEKKTIYFDRPGLEINLGSIGKGYALDRAAETLYRQWHIRSALIQGGQSSFYALGCQWGEPRGWSIGLQHPERPGERMGIIYLKNRALGTSAATYKHLEFRGRKLGHILDPRKGWPAEGMASVTVLTSTATEADALATSLFILGVEGAREFCSQHPEIGAILIPKGESVPIVLNLKPDEIEWQKELLD